MTLSDLSPGRFINTALLLEPMNWGIVFAIASLWLILMHVVMQAWGSMMAGPGQGAFAPGQLLAPQTDDTSVFSQLADYGSGNSLETFGGGITTLFTDGAESKYAEDGWTGNG